MSSILPEMSSTWSPWAIAEKFIASDEVSLGYRLLVRTLAPKTLIPGHPIIRDIRDIRGKKF
jgi:hypothetical protein